MQLARRQTSPRHFIARCLRGIEWVLAAEIAAMGGVATHVTHRQVLFQLPDDTADALMLQSADDVFVLVGTLSNIPHTRSALQQIQQGVSKLDWQHALGFLRSLPMSMELEVSNSPTGGTAVNSATSDTQPEYPGRRWNKFTVVASFLGKRNYNRFELQEAVATGSQSLLQTHYAARLDSDTQAGALTVRLHLADGRATLRTVAAFHARYLR